MEREKKVRVDLIDLGAAKKETRGGGFDKIDDVLLRPETGISKD